jgi:hypothetical protein
MAAQALIKAYEQLYLVLRALGYDSERANEGSIWLSALGALTGVWLGIELALSFVRS